MISPSKNKYPYNTHLMATGEIILVSPKRKGWEIVVREDNGSSLAETNYLKMTTWENHPEDFEGMEAGMRGEFFFNVKGSKWIKEDDTVVYFTKLELVIWKGSKPG